MTPSWWTVLAAGLVVLAIKAVGHLLPRRWVEAPAFTRTAGMITVGLLAALVVVQGATDGRAVLVDARVVALGVAAVALWLRAPFIVVVTLAAATAAVVRSAGWLT
jgi:hypothetical protein